MIVGGVACAGSVQSDADETLVVVMLVMEVRGGSGDDRGMYITSSTSTTTTISSSSAPFLTVISALPRPGLLGSIYCCF